MSLPRRKVARVAQPLGQPLASTQGKSLLKSPVFKPLVARSRLVFMSGSATLAAADE